MRDYIKVWLIKPNGNGVYVTKDNKIVVVYGNGLYTDYLIRYNEHKWAGDAIHSGTTIRAIERAMAFLRGES